MSLDFRKVLRPGMSLNCCKYTELSDENAFPPTLEAMEDISEIDQPGTINSNM